MDPRGYQARASRNTHGQADNRAVQTERNELAGNGTGAHTTNAMMEPMSTAKLPASRAAFAGASHGPYSPANVAYPSVSGNGFRMLRPMTAMARTMRRMPSGWAPEPDAANAPASARTNPSQLNLWSTTTTFRRPLRRCRDVGVDKGARGPYLQFVDGVIGGGPRALGVIYALVIHMTRKWNRPRSPSASGVGVAMMSQSQNFAEVTTGSGGAICGRKDRASLRGSPPRAPHGVQVGAPYPFGS